MLYASVRERNEDGPRNRSVGKVDSGRNSGGWERSGVTCPEEIRPQGGPLRERSSLIRSRGRQERVPSTRLSRTQRVVATPRCTSLITVGPVEWVRGHRSRKERHQVSRYDTSAPTGGRGRETSRSTITSDAPCQGSGDGVTRYDESSSYKVPESLGRVLGNDVAQGEPGEGPGKPTYLEVPPRRIETEVVEADGIVLWYLTLRICCL